MKTIRLKENGIGRYTDVYSLLTMYHIIMITIVLSIYFKEFTMLWNKEIKLSETLRTVLLAECLTSTRNVVKVLEQSALSMTRTQKCALTLLQN